MIDKPHGVDGKPQCLEFCAHAPVTLGGQSAPSVLHVKADEASAVLWML